MTVPYFLQSGAGDHSIRVSDSWEWSSLVTWYFLQEYYQKNAREVNPNISQPFDKPNWSGYSFEFPYIVSCGTSYTLSDMWGYKTVNNYCGAPVSASAISAYYPASFVPMYNGKPQGIYGAVMEVNFIIAKMGNQINAGVFYAGKGKGVSPDDLYIKMPLLILNLRHFPNFRDPNNWDLPQYPSNFPKTVLAPMMEWYPVPSTPEIWKAYSKSCVGLYKDTTFSYVSTVDMDLETQSNGKGRAGASSEEPVYAPNGIIMGGWSYPDIWNSADLD